mmetsp:Transcript_10589/g.13783  ORF Transcript_10589/g.13783 Transcript_10589/m.13783 type:complete len:284 (+) Transcript_10589:267-1118(+)
MIYERRQFFPIPMTNRTNFSYVILSLVLYASTLLTSSADSSLPTLHVQGSDSINLYNDKHTIQAPGAKPLEVLHGTTTLSFTFKNGIICAVDSRASMGSFVGSKTTQKVLPVSSTILGTMAGGAADCTYFLRWLRSKATWHELEYGMPMSVGRASRLLANALYENKLLDLSVGTMIMGFDNDVATIYYIDNSGMRIKGDLFSVGSGSTFAFGILDTKSKEEREKMDEEEAIDFAISAIRHATYRDAGSGGYIGVYVIKNNGWRKVYSEDIAMSSALNSASRRK